MERLKEHLRATSPIYDHANTTGLHTRVDNFTVVGREVYDITRTIKEAMYIKVNDPSLNINTGKFHLSHIRDEVLFNTPASTLSNPLPHSSCPLYLALRMVHILAPVVPGCWELHSFPTSYGSGRYVVVHQH